MSNVRTLKVLIKKIFGKPSESQQYHLESKPKFCTKCETHLSIHTKICPNCGSACSLLNKI